MMNIDENWSYLMTDRTTCTITYVDEWIHGETDGWTHGQMGWMEECIDGQTDGWDRMGVDRHT